MKSNGEPRIQQGGVSTMNDFGQEHLPVHEDERYVGVVCLVEVLDLLDRQVEEGQVVPHRYHRLWTTNTHIWPSYIAYFNYNTYICILH